MIKFEKFTLNNGLRVIVNEDPLASVAAVNVMYDVGSRDEDPEMTGFAHLFEHFMFAGSVNIPKYDEPLERVGGQNNAFTNNDITNYYCTLPVDNIETAFWLESDRMLDLRFTQKNLDVQKNVVIEEFKQNYLNQPYGDVWLLLRPLAYKVHPYQWSTIGKSVDHIRNATMDDVRKFYARFYNPNNAVLSVSSSKNAEYIMELAEKWFADIPNAGINERRLPAEPKQTKERRLSVDRNVSLDALYKVYHMCSRTDTEYYTTDLLSDILSNGESSRLYQELVKKQALFNNLNAYITGDTDKGLFVVSGNLNQGVDIEHAENAVIKELDIIRQAQFTSEELQKVQNKVESGLVFSETNALNRAINLAYYELVDDADIVNQMVEKYRDVEKDDIIEQANVVLDETNCSTLTYLSKQANNAQ